ncbi:hypothetical protein MAHJHV57_50160 [Mycobacterium avium subsp. hominissuis]
MVEAGLRSGAANTAAWARALGRVVAAPLRSPASTTTVAPAIAATSRLRVRKR